MTKFTSDCCFSKFSDFQKIVNISRLDDLYSYERYAHSNNPLLVTILLNDQHGVKTSFCGPKVDIFGRNLTFFDFWPPNLAKSPLRSDSIKILTKGLLHYSRKGVRMPKFSNFYRISPEISTFFSLFSYSVRWQGRRGPFPWLEDSECKRARPPRGQAWPWVRCLPLVWCFSFLLSLLLIFFISDSFAIWQSPSDNVGGCSL